MTPQHPVEPELNAPTPRDVRHRDGFAAGCGLWAVRLFVLPHTVVGAGMLGVALWSTGLYVGVWLLGTDYHGDVVKKAERRGSKGSITRTVEYEYTAGGRLYTGEVSVNADRYEQVSEGDRITVRALESAPESGPWPRLPGHWPLLEVGGKWLLALFWDGILSVFLWALYVRPYRARRLVRLGEPVVGLVRSWTAVPGKGGTSYRLTYDYPTADPSGLSGTVRTGKMTTHRKEGADYKPGRPVTVLYDPDRPWRSVIYALGDYRVKSSVAYVPWYSDAAHE